MVRVIYRWRVAPEDFEDFKEIWRESTNDIHQSVAGALGSFMLRSFTDETEVLTIARWESRESWVAFWGNQDPSQMQKMTFLGERISVEVLEEVEDYTR